MQHKQTTPRTCSETHSQERFIRKNQGQNRKFKTEAIITLIKTKNRRSNYSKI